MRTTSHLSHLYLHRASVGDEAACAAVRDDLAPLLEVLDARDDIRGYLMSGVADKEEAEEDFLERTFDYEASSHSCSRC